MAASTITRSLGKLLPSTSALFVCDVQEKFRPLTDHFPAVVEASRRMVSADRRGDPRSCGSDRSTMSLRVQLPMHSPTTRGQVRGAETLGLPIVVTGSAQESKEVENTCSELAATLPPSAKTFTKTVFSMCTPEVEEELRKHPQVKQIVLVGIEAHECVLQTTLDLLERGFEVHLIIDGIGSHRAYDREPALHRMAQSGAFLCSSEMVLFQLMKDAKHKDFRAVSALVKEERVNQPPNEPIGGSL